MKVKYLQSFCKALGNEGCYALSLIKVAQEYTGDRIDIIQALEKAISNGWIGFNENDYTDKTNFYVYRPEEFLESMTGRKWKIIVAYGDKNHSEKWKYAITKYTRYGKTHFERPEAPMLQYSTCVELGKIESYRVCMPEELVYVVRKRNA